MLENMIQPFMDTFMLRFGPALEQMANDFREIKLRSLNTEKALRDLDVRLTAIELYLLEVKQNFGASKNGN